MLADFGVRIQLPNWFLRSVPPRRSHRSAGRRTRQALLVSRSHTDPKDQWTAIQQQLTNAEHWILDGDLGPYDALEARLTAANTIIVLDFPLCRCAWRAARRSRENPAFWRWLLTYRKRSLPIIMATIANHAKTADTHLLHSPREVDEFLSPFHLTNATGTLPLFACNPVAEILSCLIRPAPASRC